MMSKKSFYIYLLQKQQELVKSEFNLRRKEGGLARGKRTNRNHQP